MLASLTLANSLLGVTGGELDAMLRDLQLPALAALPVEVRELGPAYRVANPAGVARWVDLTHGAAPRPDGKPSQPASFPEARLTLADLRTIRTPTLLVAGDADLLAPPPLMRVFARYLPDCRFVQLPMAGHSAYWEVPDAFNAAVISFIDSTRKNNG